MFIDWFSGGCIGVDVVTVLEGLTNYTASRTNLGVTVSHARGCDIALGPADRQLLQQAVALHKAADLTVRSNQATMQRRGANLTHLTNCFLSGLDIPC